MRPCSNFAAGDAVRLRWRSPRRSWPTRGPVTLLDPAPVERPSADAAALEKAVRWMAQAQRPVIWAGEGVHSADAAEQVTALAEAWCAPVVTSRGGKGAISDRHPLSLGSVELRFAPLRRWLDERDLVLAVGTSANLSRLNTRVIRIDIDPAQVTDDERTVGLVGDARTVLADLLASAGHLCEGNVEVTGEVAAINRERFDPARQLQPQAGFMQAIRGTLPDDAIVAFGMTQMGYYSRSYYPVYAPRTYLHCSRLWTLGAAFPLALGAKLAKPDRTVVAISGDGGFLYNSQELATAVKYEIPVTVVVFNDNTYGNVWRAQQEEFDGHVLGTELHNPDFVKLAESYGVRAWRAEDAGALAQALQQAIDGDTPALIEVPVGPMQRVF